MEMYYLIIAMWTYSAAIIPEKYEKEQCEQAGLASRKNYVCVKAPTFTPTPLPLFKGCKAMDGNGNMIFCDN
jgi:hypothetical protein